MPKLTDLPWHQKLILHRDPIHSVLVLVIACIWLAMGLVMAAFWLSGTPPVDIDGNVRPFAEPLWLVVLPTILMLGVMVLRTRHIVHDLRRGLGVAGQVVSLQDIEGFLIYRFGSSWTARSTSGVPSPRRGPERERPSSAATCARRDAGRKARADSRTPRAAKPSGGLRSGPARIGASGDAGRTGGTMRDCAIISDVPTC